MCRRLLLQWVFLIKETENLWKCEHEITEQVPQQRFWEYHRLLLADWDSSCVCSWVVFFCGVGEIKSKSNPASHLLSLRHPSVALKVGKKEEKHNILQILRPWDEFSPIFMSTRIFLCDSSRLREHKSYKKASLRASSSRLRWMRLHKCSPCFFVGWNLSSTRKTTF